MRERTKGKKPIKRCAKCGACMKKMLGKTCYHCSMQKKDK